MPTFDITFARPVEKTYQVRASNQDEAISLAKEDLVNNEEPESKTEGDWEYSGMQIVTEDSISTKDEDLIRNGMSYIDHIYVLNKLCSDNYSLTTQHSDFLADELVEHVRKGTVSMLAVRAIAVQMDLHRKAALDKLSVDERIALGVEV